VRPYRELALSAINLTGGADEKVCRRRQRLKRLAKDLAMPGAVSQSGRKYRIEGLKREEISPRARGTADSVRLTYRTVESNKKTTGYAGVANTQLSCPRTDI
jgi:hypothetical protein